jgi:hypothetical protein
VTLQGTAPVANVDYRAAVKPLSRAHFTTGLGWYACFEDAAAVTTPDAGSAGAVNGAPSFATARPGSALTGARLVRLARSSPRHPPASPP